MKILNPVFRSTAPQTPRSPVMRESVPAASGNEMLTGEGSIK
jgi:hypothetical protein